MNTKTLLPAVLIVVLAACVSLPPPGSTATPPQPTVLPATPTTIAPPPAATTTPEPTLPPAPIESLPPQGLYDSCAPSDADCLTHLDTLASAGFKLVINYGVFGYDVADIMSYADYANAVGMKVIWDVRDAASDPYYFREQVNAVKTHPATWGYYIADEPAYAMVLSPIDGADVSGTIELMSYSWIHPGEANFANIQFLLDGNPLEMKITSKSDDDQYSIPWDTTQSPDGPHLIQARVEDSRGITQTSEPVHVTVNNGDFSAPLTLTTASLPSAGVNASYSAIVSATGGSWPYLWRLSAGPLPDGLALDSDSGVISGVPTQAGQWTFTIVVQDSASSVAARSFALDVSASSSEEQALVRNFSELVRSLDSMHPQLLVHFDAGGGDPLGALRQFADPADVIAFDKYTLAGGELSETVTTSAGALRNFADSNRKQWGFVLQSFDGEENYPGYGFAPGWPDVARMREERDMVLSGDPAPAFIFWYSYFDILSSSDPAGHWADLINAAFAEATSTQSITDYYVSPTGSDSNDGSVGKPWRTIQHAADQVTPGTTVHVAPGDYQEQVKITRSGTSAARIRFVSDIKWGARVAAYSSEPIAVWEVAADYIDVEGFDVKGRGNDGSGGVDLAGSFDRAIGNHVHDIVVNCPPGGQAFNGGAGIVTGSYFAHNSEAIGNFVHDIRTFDTCHRVQGIYFSNPGGRILNNIVYNTDGEGITSWHVATNLTIANNLVFNNELGILIGMGDSPYYEGINVAADPGLCGDHRTDDNVVTNNIVVDNGHNLTESYGIIESGCTGIRNIYVNNIVYNNSGRDYGQDIFLQNGLAATGTLSIDPRQVMVNYQPSGGGDYHLRPASPAIDTGTSLGAPSHDFDGVARPQGAGYDRGPYEFQSTSR